MKRVLILLILLNYNFVFSQKTFIPDDAFEQALINFGYDDIFDDSVTTSSIDTIVTLYINNMGVSDLSGIEDFSSLSELFCYNNQIEHLDLSNNYNLFEVNCRSNQLTSLSVKNGNPTGLWYFLANDNPDLQCVEVDNVAYANYNWLIDNTAVFSTNCNISSVFEKGYEKKLIKIIDIHGREVEKARNQIVFYIYDDGSVDKRKVFK